MRIKITVLRKSERGMVLRYPSVPSLTCMPLITQADTAIRVTRKQENGMKKKEAYKKHKRRMVGLHALISDSFSLTAHCSDHKFYFRTESVFQYGLRDLGRCNTT